jgi:hypothetical protein
VYAFHHSDYVIGERWPQPYFRRIAAAGFPHVYWCHHWHTDFIYKLPELEQIGRWLHEHGM